MTEQPPLPLPFDRPNLSKAQQERLYKVQERINLHKKKLEEQERKLQMQIEQFQSLGVRRSNASSIYSSENKENVEVP